MQHIKFPILYSYLNTPTTYKYISMLEVNIFTVEGKNDNMMLYRK